MYLFPFDVRGDLHVLAQVPLQLLLVHHVRVGDARRRVFPLGFALELLDRLSPNLLGTISVGVVWFVTDPSRDAFEIELLPDSVS